MPQCAKDLDHPLTSDSGEDAPVERRCKYDTADDDEDVASRRLLDEAVEAVLEHFLRVVSGSALLPAVAHRVVRSTLCCGEAATGISPAEHIWARRPERDAGLGQRAEVGRLVAAHHHSKPPCVRADTQFAGAFS